MHRPIPAAVAPLPVRVRKLGRYCQWWQRCHQTTRCKALSAPAQVWKRQSFFDGALGYQLFFGFTADTCFRDHVFDLFDGLSRAEEVCTTLTIAIDIKEHVMAFVVMTTESTRNRVATAGRARPTRLYLAKKLARMLFVTAPDVSRKSNARFCPGARMSSLRPLKHTLRTIKPSYTAAIRDPACTNFAQCTIKPSNV
jgi:hypothetical protein